MRIKQKARALEAAVARGSQAPGEGTDRNTGGLYKYSYKDETSLYTRTYRYIHQGRRVGKVGGGYARRAQ